MVGLPGYLKHGLVATVWTNAKAGRRQERLQRAQWEYDRRRDAYLTFTRAARAFVPLTEDVFLLEARAGAALATSPTEELPTDTDDERMVLQFTWHDALASQPIEALSDEWKEEAPKQLQVLTAAYDGVDLEGPPHITEVARSIVATAHRLFVGKPLFEMEAKQEEAAIRKDGKEDTYMFPSDVELLNAEVSIYFRHFADFLYMAKKELSKEE
ncbi:hypothetical protein [Streptomyces californicus]|uniref:hypothetical protein n=1 Tax=Streptomyces californicus TaxID=67351 RepID=UPI0012FEF3A5|nr:hypothetical protein [Streptomyces californicus]QRV59518.1 hypothetical protein I6J40_35310 [Streptomyces californicus]